MSYPVTEKELAERLQCSQRKIAMWRHEGLLAGVKISQGWAYSEKQINGFFERYANMDISTIDQCRKVKKSTL